MAIDLRDEDVREVINSRLWNSVHPSVCPSCMTQLRFLEELVIARRHARDEDVDERFEITKDNVNEAFAWAETPQGHEFWSAVHDVHNGH